MNPSLKTLISAADADQRLILGLMSGTSLDGLDLCLCQISGSGIRTQAEVLIYETIPYDPDFRNDIKQVFAKEMVNLPFLTGLHQRIAHDHASKINDFLVNNGIDSTNIACIASHGQTIMHVPKHDTRLPWHIHATLQIGDSDHLATLTRVPVIGDFRQKHIAHGGQGAPLAVYGDYCLFSHVNVPRILINLGGISNFTYLPGGYNFEKVFVTDAGPANTLLDAWTKEKFGQNFDFNGNIARQGVVNSDLLSALQENTFFSVPFPKSTGPETFHLEFVKSKLRGRNVSDTDVLATLTYFSAWALATAIRSLDKASNCEVYASGGGTHNLVLMHHLVKLLGVKRIKSTADLGVDPDAKEAVIFAVLANEFLCSDGNTFTNNPHIPNIVMGKLSLPK